MNIGIDLVNIERFENIKETILLNKIFTEKEIEYIKKCNNNPSTIAGMFASKEAFIKAVKKGLQYDLKDIEIAHDKNGAPYINLKSNPNNYKISLSISHDGKYSTAVVILY